MNKHWAWLLLLSSLGLWVPNTDAHTNVVNNTRDQIVNVVQEPNQKSASPEITSILNFQDNDLEITPDELSKCISESIMNYFNKEVKSYSFSEQEQKILKQWFEKYFAEHKVFSVKWDKIVINMNKQWLYSLFEEFLPYFMPKLKWYSRFWIKLLGIKACTNIVYNDIVGRKWKDAETLYIEDIGILVKYIVDWIKWKYGGDMTIKEWLDSILILFPNNHMKQKMWQYNPNDLNQSISNIKNMKDKLISN